MDEILTHLISQYASDCDPIVPIFLGQPFFSGDVSHALRRFEASDKYWLLDMQPRQPALNAASGCAFVICVRCISSPL